MGHKLNFISFNVRSLIDRSRQIELLNTLHYNQIDIGFIQESHLGENKRIHINGYKFVHDDSSVGVAIVMKNRIPYTRVNIEGVRFHTTFIQVDIERAGSLKRFLVGSVYMPTSLNRDALLDGLDKILESADGFDGLIIGGDLNAKNPSWGDQSENINGKYLHEWIQTHSQEITRLCDTNPTYPNGSSFLDHFLVTNDLINRDNPNFRMATLPTFSDHFPLKLELHVEDSAFLLNHPRFFTSYRNTDWNRFRRDMEVASFCLMPAEYRNLRNEEVDTIINEFTQIFNSTVTCHSERIEIKNNKSPLPENIKKCFRVKHQWQRNLKKMYHRSGNRLSREYSILSKQISLLKIIIKNLVNMDNANKFSSRLEKIKPSSSAFKEIYSIVGKRNASLCPQIRANNVTITSTSEKCQAFCNYYSSVYTGNLPDDPVVDLSDRVSLALSTVPRNIYSFDDCFNSAENEDNYHFTDVNLIKDIVKLVNNKKSSGIDNISNFLIKKLPDSCLKLLTIIFNNCLNNCYFPTAWKTAKILPIKKKHDSTNIEDFRPISLLSNIGKIFEHVLKRKLENEFLISPIAPYQFGFRQQHSTQHALLKFHSDVVNNLREKKSTVAISLDIEKAFDSACHKGILYKLTELGVDPFLLKLFSSYFSNRKFCVEINKTLSDFGTVESGVPQGSVLAPLLFNIFLYDFPHTVELSKAILYADDCIIYSHDEFPTRALLKSTAHLNVINNFYKKWGIKINAAKSEAICIRNASGKCHKLVVPQSKILSLTLDGTEIPFKSSIKYLGVDFHRLMKFNVHGRNKISMAKKIRGMFSGLLNNKFLSQKTKLLIYKVAIRPAIMYAFPIWFSISPAVAKELEVFERSILRKCLGKNYQNSTKRFSNAYIYENSNVTPFCRYAFTLQKRFVENLETHDNCLMNDIHDRERSISWANSTYLSPIGILAEEFEEIAGTIPPITLPDFYQKTVPGSHRG